MSETTTPATDAATATDDAAAGGDALSQLRSELRAAGEVGKQQWQEAFARTREALTTTRSELERVASRTREAIAATYARAEARGADLLLRLVSQVRATAESLEASLRARAGEAPADAPAEGQPAAA